MIERLSFEIVFFSEEVDYKRFPHVEFLDLCVKNKLLRYRWFEDWELEDIPEWAEALEVKFIDQDEDGCQQYIKADKKTADVFVEIYRLFMIELMD